MDGLSGVGALGAIQFKAQYASAMMAKQKDVMELMGQNALKLIEAATVQPPGVGQMLNVVA